MKLDIRSNKMDEMLLNLENGNISDFNRQVKGLSKFHLVQLISYRQSLRTVDEQSYFQARVIGALR